jgi:hypothetical protein
MTLFAYSDFSGGLNTKNSIFADTADTGDNNTGIRYSENANNVFMRSNGLQKASGFSAILNTPLAGQPKINGIFEFRKINTTVQKHKIICAGTTIYTLDGSTLTSIYTGVNPDAAFYFFVYNNLCLLLNGVDTPLQFDGTTCQPISFNDPSSILGTAKPRFVELFRNRIFYSGDPQYPHRIWSPRPGTHNNFDNTLSTVDSFDVAIGDGQKITGLKILTRDLMVIYKQNAIYRLSGSNPFGSGSEPFKIEEVSRETGCIAPRTIINVGFEHYFLSESGIKQLSLINQYGDIQQAHISEMIPNELKALNWSETIIENSFACSIKNENDLYFHLPGGVESENNITLIYNTQTQGWTKKTGYRSACGSIMSRDFITGDYTGSLLKHFSAETYNTNPIASIWESKWLTFDALSTKKWFKSLMIYFDNDSAATITLQWCIMRMDGSIETLSQAAFQEQTESWDNSLWDTATFDVMSQSVFIINDLGRGRALKLRVINNNANEKWYARRIEFDVDLLGISGYS